MSIYTSLFWKDLLERMIATIGQVGAGLLSAHLGTSSFTEFAGLPWEAWVITILVSALFVFFKGLAAAKKGDSLSPASFAKASPDYPAISAENAGVPNDL